MPTLVASAIFLSSAPAAAFNTSCWRPTSLCSVALDSSSDDAPGDGDGGGLFSYPAVKRLQLTPDEAAVVQNRVGGITPRKQIHRKSKDDIEQTIERNLAYLEEHLGMTVEQLRRVVVGYPLLLRMELETNLIPTVEFFDDALCGGVCDNEANGNSYVQQDQRRLSAFLIEYPNLLEYNVAKRLKPRLERLRRTIPIEEDVDEEMLHAIATLTDSRFQTWLSKYNDIQESGNESDNRPQSLPRQPNYPSAMSLYRISKAVAILAT